MRLVLILVKYFILISISIYMLCQFRGLLRSLRHVFTFAYAREIAVIGWVFVFGFLALVGYQSHWQVFIDDAYFTAAQELHDPRPWIVEATTRKGKIYDRYHDDTKLLAGYTPARDGLLPRRTYPLGEAASHLIGYSDVERGKAGLEKFYFERLMGWTTYTEAEKKTYLYNKYLRLTPVGNDVVLTLDYDLQKTAYEALADKKGAVVAVMPATGDILVLVSAPSFHPDSVAVDEAWLRILQDEANQRLYNRALKGRYAPGSTFKILVACAALEKGLNPIWNIGANGYLPPGVRRKRVYDHERASYRKRGRIWRGHGELDMTTALVKSSNAFFARLGVTVGDSLLHEIAYRFGYNQPVQWNISRPELRQAITAFQSSFPTTENAHELAWSSIGQEKVLATPLQLALTAAVIANRGILMKPRLELNEPPAMWRRVISERTAEKVKSMMRQVVWAPGGTAWRMRMQEVEVAGKTGTAEVTRIIEHEDGTTESVIVNNAIFISFAPVDNPKIAVAVVAEGAGYGGAAAAPVAKEIYLKAHQLGYFNESTDGD